MLIGASAAGCGLVSGGATSAGPAGDLPLADRLDVLLDEAPFDGASWGVLVVDLGAPEATTPPVVLYERNPAARLIPASNMKTVVTAAALGILGPEFRWRTEFFSAILPSDDRALDGDLVLRGTGDPTLGAPFFEPSDEALLALADSLRAAGVERVTGALVLDASAWDSTSVPGSWMVEDLAPALGATGGAFAFSGGELAVTVVAGAAPGDNARVSWEPLGDTPFVRPRVLTVADSTGAELLAGYLPESRVWEIWGGIAAGDSTTIRFSMRDPVRVALEALAAALARTKIEIAGGTRILWERDGAPQPAGPGQGPSDPLPDDSPPEPAPAYACSAGVVSGCRPLLRLAGLTSPPLGDIAFALLGPSQNWMAEQLVRTLGSRAGSLGSWPEGSRAVAEYLAREVGVDPADLRIEDGSGLSVKNLVTPRGLVALLDHARDQPWFRDFRSALPTPRQRGTTLETRLPELEKRIFAKTGTLTNVTTLAGYLLRDDGGAVAFAILANGSNLPNSVMNARIDAIVREIARGRIPE